MGNISIIIPIFNEEISSLITRIHTCLTKHTILYEIIIIDDRSTNNLPVILQSLSKRYPITIYPKKRLQGKSFSIIEAINKARFSTIVVIDANLPCPPEVIVDMVKLLDKGTDIITLNRKNIHASSLQYYVKKFVQVFINRLLFPLPYDPHSGIKVFRRNMFRQLHLTASQHTNFDLEILYRATIAGFVIHTVDINFEQNENMPSFLPLLKKSVVSLISAVQLLFTPVSPIQIKAFNKENMRGAGLRFNGNIYYTHSTLHSSQSAIQTFVPKQKIIISMFITLLLIVFILKPVLTIQLIVGTLSFIYLADVFFGLFLIIKSLQSPQEISSNLFEITELRDEDLAIYTILCPLYKESHIIPHFLDSINKLDYPKEKLDVILLLEADDKKTIETVRKMVLPTHVRMIIVPHSYPKTKPKACNYGLTYAKGEYLVIYDAEDAPDPLQLKKAFLGFQKAKEEVFCLQAKLNYYNPGQNLLTRFFTAEYSLWFDMTLTGLQSLKTTIPLGGTSNHFKTANLRKLEGWDPFNVTEDADLGIRLFKQGYTTAIIDSVTLEEANSKWGNWIRQRSRWIKGYMQTYLVHSRDHMKLIKKTKWHVLIFHLVIGGKIAFILINPLLWLVTLSYFSLYAIVGPVIDAVYPAFILYMAVISLVLGNSLFLFYYMLGCAKKEQWELIKYIFLIPLYWVMMSVAGVIALYQLFFKPHYWEKTVHGLHFKKTIPGIIIELEQFPTGFWIPIAVRKNIIRLINLRKLYFSGGNNGKNN